MTKKSLLFSLIFSLIFVFAFSISVNASTSDSLETFYAEKAMGLGSGYYAPNVSDSNDFVDVSRGDVVINETDYVIKGRNDFDIAIVRSYNPDRLPGFVFQFSDVGSVDKPVRIGIYYINTSNNKRILVGFKTEASAYEYRDGITGVNHQEITENDNYSDWFYAIEKLEDSEGDYFYERDTSREPILITNEVSKERGVQTYCTNDQYVNIGSGWAIAKPGAIYLNDSYTGDYYRHWMTFCDIYGKSTNVEVCTYDNDDTDLTEFDGFENVESHREYVGEFVDKDDITQLATHPGGFEYNFMIKDGNGLVYYFYYATRNPDAFLRGISDRFGNVFSYEEQRSGSGYFAWTDCATGIKYTVSPDGITMQSGENATEIVSYVYSDINSDGDVGDIFSCDNQYQLTVYKNDSLSSQGIDSDNYVIYNMSKYYLMSELFCPQGGSEPIPEDLMRASHYIESIEYSNGLTKHYELTRRGTSSRCKYDVSKSYESFNDIDYNKKEYEFDGTSIAPSASNRTGSFRVDSAKTNEYISDSSKKGYTNYTFDTKGRLTQKKAYQGSSRYLTEDYTYNCDCFDSPAKTVKETKNGNITTTNTYDKYHRLTKSVYGDTQTEYTYGDNNIVTEQTSNKDASTIIKTVNTPTEDGKAVAETTVYENDVLKSKTAFTYNTDGTVASQTVYRTDEENVTTNYSYQYGQDGSTTVTQAISEVTDADNANSVNISTQIATDIFGNTTKTKDANGNETLFEYDLLLRPTKTINADGTIVSISYNDISNETTVTDARNNSFRYKFDPWGNCTEYAYLESGEYVPIESAEYDYAHRLNKYRRYNTATEYYDAVYTYDKRDRVLTETVEDASGTDISTATYTYTDTKEADYKPLSVTTMQMSDSNNTFAKTEITTDYLDRTVSKKLTDTDGNTRTYSYTYDYFGNVLTSTAPDNSTETYTYDHAGNVLSYTNQLGNTMTYAYDMSGLNTSATDFMNNTTVFSYDKLGRKVKTVSPFTDTATTTSKTYYDANGNVTREASQKTSTSYYNVNYTYDNMNRVKTVNDGSGYLTQYFYDANGNVVCMANGLSQSVNTIDSIPATAGHVLYTYDSLNRCISKGGTETGSQSVPVSYSYDRAGNVIGKHLYTGDISYTFDAFGNIKSTSGASSVQESFSYNALGQRTSMTDETGTTTYTYDDFGNLTTETNGDIVKTSTYDVMGNRIGFTVTKNGTAILTNTYTYDATGKMLSVTSNGQTVTYAYDANGNLLTETGSDYNVTNTYNKANLPVTQVNTKGNTAINNYSMSYDLSGNKTLMTDSPVYVYNSFTYDSAGRLIYESLGHERGMEVEGDTEYRYNNMNNRSMSIKTSPLNPDGKHSEYIYGDYNQLMSIESWIGYEPETTDRDIVTYTYDNNGNLSSRIKTDSSNEILESATYTFNNAGRMTQSTQNGVTTTYTYNGDGLRMSKTTNGVTTSFILDGAEVIAEIKGNEITIYSRGLGLVSQTKGDTTKTYFSDSHGDITSLHSADADSEEALYDGFGNTLFNDSSDNPFGYCGEYYDEETGLIYLRARYYDPEIGRFISEDPAMDGTNWYVYCSNNPVNRIDPTGEYDRDAAVNFALKYGILDKDELYYPRFNPDCTNFVSQSLRAGGIEETDEWYFKWALSFNGYVTGISNYSISWSVANEQYKLMKNPDNNYINGDVLIFHEYKYISDNIKYSNVQVGDLLYWDDEGDGTVSHAAIIVSVDNGDITYAQHSGDKINGSLTKYLKDNPSKYVYLVRIKNDAQ